MLSFDHHQMCHTDFPSLQQNQVFSRSTFFYFWLQLVTLSDNLFFFTITKWSLYNVYVCLFLRLMLVRDKMSDIFDLSLSGMKTRITLSDILLLALSNPALSSKLDNVIGHFMISLFTQKQQLWCYVVLWYPVVIVMWLSCDDGDILCWSYLVLWLSYSYLVSSCLILSCADLLYFVLSFVLSCLVVVLWCVLSPYLTMSSLALYLSCLCRVFVLPLSLSCLCLCRVLSLSCLVFLCCVVLWWFAFPCLVLPCLVFSCLVLSCLVLSCLVLSCLVLSCLVLACLVLSCFVLSCLFWYCLIVSYLSSSCLMGLSLPLSWLNWEVNRQKRNVLEQSQDSRHPS